MIDLGAWANEDYRVPETGGNGQTTTQESDDYEE